MRPPPPSTLFPYTTLFRSRAVPGFRVLEHLLIADRVAEGRARTAADHQMDALGFARLVVVQKQPRLLRDRKSTRLNSSHLGISYAVFCLKKKRRPAHTPAR